MQLSYSALLVAALSFGSAIALPGDKLGRYADYSSREPSSFVSQYLTRLFDRIHYRHQHKHKRDAVDYSTISYSNLNLGGVDFSTINYGGSSSATGVPVAASVTSTSSTTASASATSSASVSTATGSSGSDASGLTVIQGGPDYSSSTYTTGVNGFGARVAPVAAAEAWNYKANYGNPHGSNLLLIKESSVSQYTYTKQIRNDGSQTETFVVWNQVGTDGQANSGSFDTPVFTISLAPGTYQYMAFDENSSGAMSRACDKTTDGQRKCTWVEFTFGGLQAKGDAGVGYSSYDVSSIVSQVDSEAVGAWSDCSSKNASTSSTYTYHGLQPSQNNYVVSNANADDIAPACAPGNANTVASFHD